MCEEFNDAMKIANNNLVSLGDSIYQLRIPCNYKAEFLKMADDRGFRFKDDTLMYMQAIGDTDSKVLIPLLDGKKAGLASILHLAMELKDDRERALVLEELNEHNLRYTEVNVLKAILTIQNQRE